MFLSINFFTVLPVALPLIIAAPAPNITHGTTHLTASNVRISLIRSGDPLTRPLQSAEITRVLEFWNDLYGGGGTSNATDYMREIIDGRNVTIVASYGVVNGVHGDYNGCAFLTPMFPQSRVAGLLIPSDHRPNQIDILGSSIGSVATSSKALLAAVETVARNVDCDIIAPVSDNKSPQFVAFEEYGYRDVKRPHEDVHHTSSPVMYKHT